MTHDSNRGPANLREIECFSFWSESPGSYLRVLSNKISLQSLKGQFPIVVGFYYVSVCCDSTWRDIC